MPRHFPEEKVSGRIYPDSMNKHLQPSWCEIRNSIAKDQEGVDRCLEGIRFQKSTIKFLKDRVVASLNALDALEGVK